MQRKAVTKQSVAALRRGLKFPPPFSLAVFLYSQRLQSSVEQPRSLTEKQEMFLREFRAKLEKEPVDSFAISAASPTTEPVFQNIKPRRGTDPLPSWLKLRVPKGSVQYPNYVKIRNQLREKKLATVCQEAKCPNIGECWGGIQNKDGTAHGATATIMMMGKECTRGCRFCSIKTSVTPAALDPQEPEKIAQALAELSVDYIVITMVDRDDLDDGGSKHVAKTIQRVRAVNPSLYLECLVGDFKGSEESVKLVASSGLHVYAHNIETVERLTPRVRDRKASYTQSMNTLRWAKETWSSKAETSKETTASSGTNRTNIPGLFTKSSIMVGLGETTAEVIAAMRDLRSNAVDFLTIGQYLQPDLNRMKVTRYVEQQEFDYYKEEGEKMGFRYVASGPLVRSSYKAGEFFIKNVIQGN